MEDFSLLHTPAVFHLVLGSETDLRVFYGGKKIYSGVIWSQVGCQYYPSCVSALQWTSELRGNRGSWRLVM